MIGHEPPPVVVPEVTDAPYRLQGDFLEVCDCFTICPCWTGRAPDEGVCTGVFAWAIAAGDVDGTDVAGRTVVSVSTHEGHRDTARQRVVVFVDAGAGDAEAAALAAAFSGSLGGPLGELRRILGDLLAVERAVIRVEGEGRRARLTVGRVIEAETVGLVGPGGGATSLANARLSKVLGNPAAVGTASRFRVGLPGRGIDIDVRGRSAMRGSFDYRHDVPRPPPPAG